MAGDFPHLASASAYHWPAPNLVDPHSRGWFPPYAITFWTVATAALSARLHSQHRSHSGRFALDDYLAIVAWIFATLFTGICTAGTLKYGYNMHIWDVPHSVYRPAALIEWISEATFLMSTCLIKVSVLCFFRRLETPCTKVLRGIICAFIAFIVFYTLAFVLELLLLCRPITDYWTIPDSLQPDHRNCASQHISYPLQGSLDSFSCFFSVVIPYLVLRARPMSNNQRVGLRAACILSLGVMGAGVARTVFLVRLADSANGDATWNGFNVFVSSQLECQLSLVCASLPFFQRYLSHYRVPIVYTTDRKDPSSSVMSRVSSSLSGSLKRGLHIGRSSTPRQPSNLNNTTPQAVEIPEWEFETLESPRNVPSPVDVENYDRYLAGQYGPPPPPKDTREIFEQYRRERYGGGV